MLAMASSASRPSYSPNSISDSSYVRILDTTLRDGEQAPGAAMTAEQKLAIARRLYDLGVDVIEAGFPTASLEDLEAVRAIANEIGTRQDESGHVPVIGAVARSNRRDIDATWEAVKGALRPRISTFLATSEIHMVHKLKMSRREVVAMAAEMVAYARSLGCPDVTFAAEDAGRSDREFLYHVLEEVIKAGATTVIIPDTVGYTLPSEFRQLIADIKSNTPGIENVIIASHCHNDLGLATANTLAAAEGGARQLEVTVNGIGERAGNASLEEVVMAIKCRKELLGGLYTGINTKHILPTSKMVMEYTGLHVQPYKAIVGPNVFSHESGIHQDGVLKFRGTYEIISPIDIGLSQSNGSGIVLGKLSGRHAVKTRLLKLGYDINGKEFDDIFKRFKELAKKKKRITDDDLESLVIGKTIQSKTTWSLGNIQVTHGNVGFSTAIVKLISLDGKERIECSHGEGPVDAAYEAINNIVQVPVTVVEHVSSTSGGTNAIASTRVVICEQNRNSSTHTPPEEEHHHSFSGEGADVDIVVSSVQAYLNALNMILAFNDLSARKLSNGKV